MSPEPAASECRDEANSASAGPLSCDVRRGRGVDGAILAVLTLFLLWHLDPASLLLDTTAVGGDTPAHNYLASHLSGQLFGHGRIISWAGGWWCGFPMFQYYFCLPYILMALLGVVLPFNIAFKLVSVLGLLLLPACAYAMGSMMRFSRPTPLLMALLTVPFLFVRVHTMWGVNILSTLAGMIANSLSFALMLPAIGSAYRDAAEDRFRLRTALLLALVMASHFFTAVVTALTLAAVPVVVGYDARADGRLRRTGAAVYLLAKEGGLALLLMSWWWVPLIAKAEFSMEFGTNWRMTLWKNFPAYTAAVLPFAVLALAAGRRAARAVWVLAWMLAVSLALFVFGFGLSPVFVNVRLWPFMFFAALMLGAAGLGWLAGKTRGHPWLTAAMAAAVLAAVAYGDLIPGTRASLVRTWARWNYSGLELKPAGGVFDQLVFPLAGTKGRLANDLCEENNALGSTRVFELAPHLAGKPVLEGGLVNSGFSSLFAYYVQSETSKTCAGYPPLVVPATFNFTNATRHLELFNVKHFIARWEGAKAALRSDPRWRFVQREDEWELYELMSHDGSYVTIPRLQPVAVVTERWKECSLEWLYTIAAIDQPFLFVPPGRDDELGRVPARLTEAEFRRLMADMRAGSTGGVARTGAACPGGRIRDEQVSDDRIAFKTDAVGQPHLIKCSYFPNWQVRGAKRVFMASPGSMLVFPEQEQVELYYGSLPSDRLGRALTALGCCLVLGAGLARVKRRMRDSHESNGAQNP